MNPDGVKVFHGTDGEHVARAVAQNFEFDLFPAADVFFYEHLCDGREHQTVVGNQAQLLFVMRHAAARAAERVGRAHDDGITELIGNCHAFVHGIGNVGRHDGLMDFLHRFLEKFTVLAAIDRVELGADEFDPVFSEKSRFCQLTTHGKPRLTAEGGEERVGFFLDDDTL